MLQISALTFLNPWALWALIALPFIWWLLRLTPQRPERIAFPPLRFLLELVSHEKTANKAPWWLVALRLMIGALVIAAMASPVLNRSPQPITGKGPVLVILDDGWASAKNWSRFIGVLEEIVETAEREARTVSIQTTAPRLAPRALEPVLPRTARDIAAAISAISMTPSRKALARRLEARFKSEPALNVVWLSDGVDYGDGAAFGASLSALAGGAANVSVFVPQALKISHVIKAPVLEKGQLALTILRAKANKGDEKGAISAIAANGRILGSTGYVFEDGDAQAKAVLELPVALRNEVARLSIAGARSAASVFLLDDSWQKKSVGLVSGKSLYFAQPLLSPLYYVSRALEPFAELKRAPLDEADSGISSLIEGGLSMLILADIGQLQENDRVVVEDWLRKGGTLVRFAGPRLAARHDDLVPVKLRQGGRSLSGALSWAAPQLLSPFDEDSPFYGLSRPDDVFIARQVLAEPDQDLNQKIWARLDDGTPLVTASKLGLGTIVLFHVTASPEWSNLPLSGLFVDMLRRLSARSQSIGATGGQAARQNSFNISGAFAPVRILDGAGELINPSADAAPIPARDIRDAEPAPKYLPGLYRRAGQTRAINIAGGKFEFTALDGLPSGIFVDNYVKTPAFSLKHWLLGSAFLLLLVDALASFWSAGRLYWWGKPRAAPTVPVVFATGALALFASSSDGAAQDVGAQDWFAMQATLDIRLAFVITGDKRIDDISRTGLYGLSDYISRKTSLGPEAPIGVDIEKDEIIFFPLLYWPVHQDAKALSKQGASKISSYLKSGGMIFFDTRDHQDVLIGVSGEGAVRRALRRILAGIDIPPLETVPPDHVLTKAFYLLNSFPGRWAGGKLWVEVPDRSRTSFTSTTDGVSPVIIGSNDYAAAWATDPAGRPLYPTVPGEMSQREFAFRTGVNIVMYAVTGNYKADQVHAPSILERLGQ